MKRIAIITIVVIILLNSPNLFTAEPDDFLLIRSANYQKLSFDYEIDPFSISPSDNTKKLTDIILPDGNIISSAESFLPIIASSIKQFSFGAKDTHAFSLKKSLELTLALKNKNNYSKAASEVTMLNLTVWTFNKYLMKESWANISLESIFTNLKSGFAWDIDTFRTNQLGHPYHGAIHYSIARANGLSFLESTIYSTLGSFTWEIFLESIRPSTNDLILNTLGGITLGEALFKIADLVIDESSNGLERALRESLAFLINPAFGFRVFSERVTYWENPQEKPYYSLDLPFGAYKTSANRTNFLIAASLEYKDFLKKEAFKIDPYDWFTLDCRLGFHEYGIRDKEIFTTGVITGKKVKNGLAGLFGVFDYINTQTIDKMSAIGMGPGIVTIFVSDSNLFFNSSGVLSLIFGGASPSFNPERYHFGKKVNDPYYLGPGMLGRVKLELGKKGIGSIDTGFSQYWVHSIYTHANEFLAILSVNLKCDLSNKSQISLGYDYYLRYASLQEERFTGSKPTVRALYVLKF